MYPQKGTFDANTDADITKIDLKKEQTVNHEQFEGISDYLDYEGWQLKGWPVKTFVRGEIISEDFEVIGKKGYGKLVPRINSI